MLEVKNISKFYGEKGNKVVALNNVSMQMNEGDFIAIMGPSGSGKSTLLNIIGGLDRLSGGEVNQNENALVEIRRNRIAYVFQQYHLLPSLTAIENVYLPLLFYGTNGKSLHIAMDVLKIVGLENRAKHRPGQLSGGEQQRVAIARAIINNPPLILADEPTGNMDQKTGADILGLFDQLNARGLGIIMVTHSHEVAKHARQVIFLEDGQIVKRINQKGRTS
jgi:putative ABC transport system ATP-binding protein